MKLQAFKCSNCGSHHYSSASYNGTESTHDCRDCGSTTKDGVEYIEVPYPSYTILGQEVDSSKEFEQFFDKETGFEFGVNISIEFRDEAFYTSRTIYNITEIHNLYMSAIDNRVAFESDLQGSGWTPELAGIKNIVVVAAEKLHTDYYTE